jgi:5-methylcytosine-specific restriction endonuclease McrA
MGHSSLYQYATKALRLSENEAYTLITVSRKAKQIPELKEAIFSGKINTSQARRITAVITQENKTEWIGKAAILGQKELEKEIARVAPKEAVKEKMTYVTENRIELKCGISETLMKELELVKDLLSKKTRRPSSLEDALKEVVTFYIDKKDPVKKAERSLTKPKRLASRREHMATHGGRTPIPSAVKHQVVLRDQGQCTHQIPEGKRCDDKRWVEIHHRVPVSGGGKHTLENLVSLCSNHHKLQHELEL